MSTSFCSQAQAQARSRGYHSQEQLKREACAESAAQVAWDGGRGDGYRGAGAARAHTLRCMMGVFA